MRKIINPYTEVKGYNCFGCSPKNSYGLQMEFMEDGDEIYSEWKPKSYYQGYREVLHGGIQAALIDEIASWCVQLKLRTAGVTSNMDIRYKQPVYTNGGNIKLRAKLKNVRRNIAAIKVILMNSKDNLCSKAVVSYFTFPERTASRLLYYPGYKKFFDESDGD